MYFASCSLISFVPRDLIISLSASASGPVDVVVTLISSSSALFSSLKLGMTTVPSILLVVPVIFPYITHYKYLIHNICNHLENLQST